MKKVSNDGKYRMLTSTWWEPKIPRVVSSNKTKATRKSLASIHRHMSGVFGRQNRHTELNRSKVSSGLLAEPNHRSAEPKINKLLLTAEQGLKGFPGGWGPNNDGWFGVREVKYGGKLQFSLLLLIS